MASAAAGWGNCSLCDMALEPRRVTLDETPNPELRPSRADVSASSLVALLPRSLALARAARQFALPVWHGKVPDSCHPWLACWLLMPSVRRFDHGQQEEREAGSARPRGARF